jgi:hypothetical protein
VVVAAVERLLLMVEVEEGVIERSFFLLSLPL